MCLYYILILFYQKLWFVKKLLFMLSVLILNWHDLTSNGFEFGIDLDKYEQI